MENTFLSYYQFRKDVHRHPELSNEERETTGRIKHFLESNRLKFVEFEKFYGGYTRIDVGADKTFCMRADIDALPLKEDTGADFCSENSGVMHACGHDMHTAIAAGLACELNKVKERLSCNIVILFQPAEEANPVGGAKPLVDSGFLEEQKIDEVYALHMWPSLPVGEMEVCAGPIMAASDRFIVKIQGKSAHAAEPHKGVDAILIGNDICTALSQKLRREVDPFSPVSISIGSFKTIGRYNIICDHVILEGTVRTTNEKTRELLQHRIKEIASSVARCYGGSATVEIIPGYGVVFNDKKLFCQMRDCAERVLGQKNVHTDIHCSLIGEDFYYYGTKAPVLYLHMGCESQYPLHSNRFLPNEKALEYSIKLMREYFLSR